MFGNLRAGAGSAPCEETLRAPSTERRPKGSAKKATPVKAERQLRDKPANLTLDVNFQMIYQEVGFGIQEQVQARSSLTKNKLCENLLPEPFEMRRQAIFVRLS